MNDCNEARKLKEGNNLMGVVEEEEEEEETKMRNQRKDNKHVTLSIKFNSMHKKKKKKIGYSRI